MQNLQLSTLYFLILTMGFSEYSKRLGAIFWQKNELLVVKMNYDIPHGLYRDLNCKRPGASSDNNFIFEKINKN